VDIQNNEPVPLSRLLFIITESATYNMRELRAIWVVDSQILNCSPQLVHALHVTSQPATRTGTSTYTAQDSLGTG